MKSFFILLCILATPVVHAQNTEQPGLFLFPILNYVFFEEGASTLPERYVLLPAEATESFLPEFIPGEYLEPYYYMLNIYGHRLRMYPDAVIELVGCNNQRVAAEKRPGLSEERAMVIRDYLKNVWGIREDRIRITVRNLPAIPSNGRDSLGALENCRVEILCDTWEVTRPLLMRAPEGEDTALAVYHLIQFPFNQYQMGPMNERIVKGYLLPRITPASRITVTGSAPPTSIPEHPAIRLSTERVRSVANFLDKQSGGTYTELQVQDVGEAAWYTPFFPEGRFYGRAVRVLVRQ